MDPRIAEVERQYLRTDLPAFAPGDTIRVRVRVREGGKERIQPFEGICIGKRGAGVNATFMLRRISGGVGVERIFPLHSPWIAGIEVVRRGDVRRAKLYYLRNRTGKRARVRERKWWLDKESIAEHKAGGSTRPQPEVGAEAMAEVADEALDVAEGATAAPDEAASMAEAGDAASTAEVGEDVVTETAESEADEAVEEVTTE